MPARCSTAAACARCLNHDYRAYCRDWADAALEAGADLTFWDEPHWVVPDHVGIDDPEGKRWGCRCDVCRERFGDEMPTELTDEVLAFREASLVDFLGEMVAHVRSRGGRSTICLLPAVEGAHGVGTGTRSPRFRAWTSSPPTPTGTSTTSPRVRSSSATRGCWRSRPACRRDRRALAAGVPPDQEGHPGLRRRRRRHAEGGHPATLGLGVRGLRTQAISRRPTRTEVWEAAAAAMTGTDALESLDTEQRGAVDDLDRRSTLELVELMAEEDALVPAAVARAAPRSRRSTTSSTGCRAAVGSSTSAQARPAGSRPSTPTSARRRSRCPPAPWSRSSREAAAPAPSRKRPRTTMRRESST